MRPPTLGLVRNTHPQHHKHSIPSPPAQKSTKTNNKQMFIAINSGIAKRSHPTIASQKQRSPAAACVTSNGGLRFETTRMIQSLLRRNSYTARNVAINLSALPIGTVLDHITNIIPRKPAQLGMDELAGMLRNLTMNNHSGSQHRYSFCFLPPQHYPLLTFRVAHLTASPSRKRKHSDLESTLRAQCPEKKPKESLCCGCSRRALSVRHHGYCKSTGMSYVNWFVENQHMALQGVYVYPEDPQTDAPNRITGWNDNHCGGVQQFQDEYELARETEHMDICESIECFGEAGKQELLPGTPYCSIDGDLGGSRAQTLGSQDGFASRLGAQSNAPRNGDRAWPQTHAQMHQVEDVTCSEPHTQCYQGGEGTSSRAEDINGIGHDGWSTPYTSNEDAGSEELDNMNSTSGYRNTAGGGYEDERTSYNGVGPNHGDDDSPVESSSRYNDNISTPGPNDTREPEKNKQPARHCSEKGTWWYDQPIREPETEDNGPAAWEEGYVAKGGQGWGDNAD